MRNIFVRLLPAVGSFLMLMAPGCKPDIVVEPEPEPQPIPTVVFNNPQTIGGIEKCVARAERFADTDTMYSLSTPNAYVLDSVASKNRILTQLLDRGGRLENLKWDKSGGRVFADADNTVWFIDDYLSHGFRLVPNPDNGIMPYAETQQELDAWRGLGFAEIKKIIRAQIGWAENYEINLLRELIENFKFMEQQISDAQPFGVKWGMQINYGNTDADTVMNILETLHDGSVATLSGNLVLGPADGAVKISSDNMKLVQSLSGKLAPSGLGAFHLGDAIDELDLASQLSDNVPLFRVNSVNLNNAAALRGVAYPDTLNVPQPMLGNGDNTDFAGQLDKVPIRPKNLGRALLKLNGNDVNVFDDKVLRRIAQPALDGTDTYPNPDIKSNSDMTIPQMNATEWSDSTSLGTKQRLLASLKQGVKTRLMYRDYGDLKFYKGNLKNRVDAFGLQDLTMVHAKTFREFTEYNNHSPLWQVDLKQEKIAIVLDDGVVLKDGSVDVISKSIWNRDAVYTATGAQIVIRNQYVDEYGVGNLDTWYRLGIPVVLYSEYVLLEKAGKSAR